MSGLILIGGFGLSLVTVGLLENMGVKINSTFLNITMECIKYGGILYILKLAASTFL